MVDKYKVTTYYNKKGHLYYTLGNCHIMYDICYPIAEAITNDTMYLGAAHCRQCFRDATVKNVVIGTCIQCTNNSKTTWKCSCTTKYGFYNAFEYTDGCKDKFCVIRYYLSHVDYHCIGSPQYEHEYFNYHTYKGDAYISKHTYFDEENDEYDNECNEECNNIKKLTLIHPDTIASTAETTPVIS